MRKVKNLESVCKGDTGSVCKINVLVSFISTPKKGTTPRHLQGSEVTKDWGFVKTKTDKEKYAFVKGKNDVAVQCSRHW